MKGSCAVFGSITRLGVKLRNAKGDNSHTRKKDENNAININL